MASVGQRDPEAGEIVGTRLLAPDVIDDPYLFYRQLRAQAPVWEVPGTALFTVSTFELVAEATGRVEDFSSNICWLLYRDGAGLPCRLPFGDAGAQALATADPPMHTLHRKTVFPELVAKRMAELEPDIVNIVDECVARALGQGTVEFMTAIGNVLPITMISRLVGFHDSNMDQLLHAGVRLHGDVGVHAVLRRAAGAHHPQWRDPDLARRSARRGGERAW